MMENKFDDAIKKRLGNFESDIPADIWDRITGKDRKRRFVFIPGRFGLLALLLLCGIAGSVYFLPGKTKTQTNITQEQVTTNDVISATHKSAGGIENKSDNKSNTIPVNNQIVNEKQAVNQFKKNGLLKKNNRTRKSKDNNKEFYPATQSTTSTENKNLFTTQSEKDSSNNKPMVAASSSPVKNEKKPATDDSLHADEEANTPGGEDKFSLELFASPELPVNVIRSTNKSYEQILKNSGDMQISFNIGLRAKYHISKHLAAKIGLQYTRITSKTNFSDSLASYYTANNRYISISVPLLFSYKIRRFSFADLSVNSGILLNVFSRTKGLLPSMTGPLIDMDKGNVYNKNVSATFFISADISKKLQGRTELFMEPWFSYRLKNMVNRYYTFDQRIHGFGLSFGIRYRLFKNEFQ